jgi:hypothetical protein
VCAHTENLVIDIASRAMDPTPLLLGLSFHGWLASDRFTGCIYRVQIPSCCFVAAPPSYDGRSPDRAHLPGYTFARAGWHVFRCLLRFSRFRGSGSANDPSSVSAGC